MKKYKVVKDFPGNNEKIGDVIRFHIGTFPEYFGPSGKRYCAKDIENYPEFLQLVKQAPKIGTKVKIKGAVNGCYVMEGKVGIVTNEVGGNGLLDETDYVGDLEAFNVKVNDSWIGRVACTDWQEVVELDYEILSFIGKSNRELRRYGNMCYGSHRGEYSMIQCLECGLEIKAIKRPADNEVFGVGDKVRFNGASTYRDFTIDNFFKKNDGILARNKYNIICEYISDIKHVKKPLFITEDGVEIFAGDYYWYTYTNNLCCCRFTAGNSGCVSDTFDHKNKLSFSTKELCDAYIDENKPKYSELDMLDFGMNCAISRTNGIKFDLKNIFGNWKLRPEND